MKKIVILNGPPNSGKDTIANMITAADRHNTWGHMKFAEPLKAMVHKFLDIQGNAKDIEALKDRPIEWLGDGELITLRELYIRMSEDVLKPLLGKAVFGKMFMRSLHEDPRFNTRDYIIVSGSGFKEEIAWVGKRNGWNNVCIVHLYRDNTGFGNDSRRYVTSKGIEHKHFMFSLYNNRTPKDTVEDLFGTLREINFLTP